MRQTFIDQEFDKIEEELRKATEIRIEIHGHNLKLKNEGNGE